MTFREITFGTPDYGLTRRLRDEVLRKPLGRALTPEDLAGEESQLHFGLFDSGGDLAACVVAVPVSATEARIRQMAVSPARRGRGLGRRLMDRVEQDLRGRGVRTVVLNARESAVGFYEKLGYSVVGDAFVHLAVPHFRMIKDVGPA